MSILIVDDSREQQDLLSMILHKAGYGPLVTAGLATTAFQHLGLGNGSSSSCAVDVILMDLLMPDIDGLEACRRIREEEHLQHLPIIVITAKTAEEDLQAAYSAGATDYIRKPVIPGELIARVATALSIKQEMDARKLMEQELRQRNQELQRALDENKTLQGLIRICVKCKRIRTDSGYWQRIEEYIQRHSEVKLDEGVCQTCLEQAHPAVFKKG